MREMERHIVSNEENGVRLDRMICRRYENLPWHKVQHILRRREIWVDGTQARGNMRLRSGQIVTIAVALEDGDKVSKPTLIPKEKADEILQSMIIYQSKNLLVLNKPQGLAVQGGTGLGQNHLDALLQSSYGKNAHLVHRLDRQASGLLLVALTMEMARHLTFLFRKREIFKIYWGVTINKPPRKCGFINEPIGALRQEARTFYHMITPLKHERALVAFYPVSGRKHQIRAHASLQGMPLLGDERYGGGGGKAKMQLHGRRMQFCDLTGEKRFFVAPPTPAMTSFLLEMVMDEEFIEKLERKAYEWLQEQII